MLLSNAKAFIKGCLEPAIDALDAADVPILIADNINYKVTQGSKAGTVEIIIIERIVFCLPVLGLLLLDII